MCSVQDKNPPIPVPILDHPLPQRRVQRRRVRRSSVLMCRGHLRRSLLSAPCSLRREPQIPTYPCTELSCRAIQSLEDSRLHPRLGEGSGGGGGGGAGLSHTNTKRPRHRGT